MSDAPTIPPALTSDEWAEWFDLGEDDCLIIGSSLELARGESCIAGEGDVEWPDALTIPGVRVEPASDGDDATAWLTGIWVEDGSTPAAITTPRQRHALAALCLYEQPFGFTASDLAWLRRMEFTSLDRAEVEAHQVWFQSYLARIAALLPPEPP